LTNAPIDACPVLIERQNFIIIILLDGFFIALILISFVVVSVFTVRIDIWVDVTACKRASYLSFSCHDVATFRKLLKLACFVNNVVVSGEFVLERRVLISCKFSD